MQSISPTVLAALLGAIVGAILSAVLTNIVRAAIERRARRREGREALVAETAALASEVIADLGLWALETRTQESLSEQHRALSAYTRAFGRLEGLQIRAWRLFPEWHVRAALTKFAGRVREVAEQIEARRFSSAGEFQLALEWLHEAADALCGHLADSIGLRLSSTQTVVFLGFTKHVRLRRQELARTMKADPMPWLSYLQLALADLTDGSEQAKAAYSANFSKIVDLRCPTHQRAPHVRLVGITSNFSIEVEGCCDQLGELTRKALMRGHTEA